MNQILDYGAGGNSDNSGKSKKNNNFKGGNNYNNGMNGGKTPMSDKVIKVFALLMIIIAIGLIVSGVFSLLKNKEEDSKKSNSTTQAQKVEAEISADLDEIAGTVKITVKSPVAISKMIYSWDEEHDTVIAGKKQTTLEEETVSPSGKHVLHVQVTDEQNNKTTKEFTFDSATGVDKTSPEISLTVTEDKQLLVTAKDDTSIEYVTYTWNDGETVTMTPEEEGLKEYEFELEIPKGKNTIVVFAVDGSEEGNAMTVTKVLEGVTKPTITYGFLDAEGKVLQITCTHENGIKSINYTFNGQEGKYESPEGEEPLKEITFSLPDSIDGNNVLLMTVTSVDNTSEEFNSNWTYPYSSESSEEDNPNENSGEDNENVVSDETEENN